MGKKVGLDLAAITQTAVTIVESNGLEAATLSSVAEALGVKVPSLYNHVSGLAGLRRLISIHAAEQLTGEYRRELAELVTAVQTADSRTRLRAIANAHRHFAITHPGLYQALLPAPPPGEDDELFSAMSQPVLIAIEAYTGIAADTAAPAGLTDDPNAIHRLRALRSLIHGFVHLELNGGFGLPVDLETSFGVAVDAMIAGITD